MKLRLLAGAAVLPMLLAHPVMASELAEVAVVQPAAQSVLSGRVSDPSGNPLPGALVSIEGTNIQTSTNLQGEYVLTGVPAGTSTVRTEYLGYPTRTDTITASAGMRAVLDVTLGSSATMVSEVVITGTIGESAARALNQQRAADNTLTVVSSDSIGRFPDANIAEALQRVSGVAVERDQGEGRYINVRGAPAEFTAVSVDGVSLTSPDPTTRAIDLDTIPADIVNSLEVAKTLLPSQDADSIAGAVNIVTRSPFDIPRLRVNAAGGFSYNEFGGTNDQRASATVSNVFADGMLGALLSVSYSRTVRQVDNVESEWAIVDAPEGGEVFGVIENLFKDYDTRRERISLTGGVEFRPSALHRYYVRGSFSRFTDDEFRNRLGILWDEGVLQPGATDRTATWTNTRLEKQFRHRIQRNEITTLSAGGEHFLDFARIDYNLSFARAEQTYPSRNELLWRSTIRPTLSYDYTNPNMPYISLFDTNQHLNEGAYAFRENTFRTNDTTEEEWATRFNIEIPSSFAGNAVTWRFGGAYRMRDVVADEERFRDRRALAAPPNPMTFYLSGTPSDNYDYLLGRKFEPGPVRDYLNSVRAISERRIPQSITADYEADEHIAAAYGMARVEFGGTDLIVGLRGERTRFEGSAPGFNEDTGVVTTLRANSTRTHWFPNLTIRHAFTENLIGRVALTRGINRPNYVDIVPRVVEATDGAIVRVTSGNPDLAPTLSNNFDAGIEYYVAPLGFIGFNVFYKDLSDYRYTLTLAGTYLGAPAQFTRAENAPDGYIRGFEVNWQQQFAFLPGFMSGFGVFANYTYADAEIDLGRTYAGRSTFELPGQSHHSYNLAAFYEAGGFSTRLSWTKRSDYLDEINADDGRFDLYWEGRGQLDFTSSYEFTPNIEVFLEAKNLTNSAGVRYFGSRERVYEYEKFGYNVFLGVRLRL